MKNRKNTKARRNVVYCVHTTLLLLTAILAFCGIAELVFNNAFGWAMLICGTLGFGWLAYAGKKLNL